MLGAKCHLAAAVLLVASAFAQTPPLRITTETLPPAAQRQSYTAQLQASGGTSPLKWEIVKGKLPDGLQLDAATGMLAGAPTGVAEARFTVQVTDSAGQTAEREFQLRSLPPLDCEWKKAPVVQDGGIQGAVTVTNGTNAGFDLTFIVVAVNEIGKAFALGYQHVTMAAQSELPNVPFGSSLPRGHYIIHVDCVAEDTANNRIFRARLQTPTPFTIP